LLEEDAILAVLAGGDADAGDFAADASVAEDVVGAGGLFHPPWIELLKLASAEDGFFDVPLLVGVHHELVGGADFFADEAGAALVIGGVAADFELEVGPAGGEGFVAEAGDFLVAEADPACGCSVGGKAVDAEVFEAVMLAGAAFFEEGDGFFAGESVVDVVEVDDAGDALGFHLGEELPEGFLFGASVEVPYGVDEGGGGEVDDAFFRAEPAELRVAGELTAEGAEVVGDGAEDAALDGARKVAKGLTAELGSAAQRKGEAEAAEALVGFEDAVGSGVVRILVDGVGADAFPGGGKAEVDDLNASDAKVGQRVGVFFPICRFMRGVGIPSWLYVLRPANFKTKIGEFGVRRTYLV